MPRFSVLLTLERACFVTRSRAPAGASERYSAVYKRFFRARAGSAAGKRE